MLERPKISPSQQPKSLGISPSDFPSKSLGVRIENGQVTWRKNFKWLGLQDRRKTGPGLRMFRETITAKALWRHNSGHNAAAVATHSNIASRTMAFTFKCLQHYHIKKTKWYGYHIRRTKWYGYADHGGCIRVKLVLDKVWHPMDGFVQDCGISIANIEEIL